MMMIWMMRIKWRNALSICNKLICLTFGSWNWNDGQTGTIKLFKLRVGEQRAPSRRTICVLHDEEAMMEEERKRSILLFSYPPSVRIFNKFTSAKWDVKLSPVNIRTPLVKSTFWITHGLDYSFIHLAEPVLMGMFGVELAKRLYGSFRSIHVEEILSHHLDGPSQVGEGDCLIPFLQMWPVPS